MTPILFINREVISLLQGGENMRVDTDAFSTASLIQAASDVLAVVAHRMRQDHVRREADRAADRGRVPEAGGGR